MCRTVTFLTLISRIPFSTQTRSFLSNAVDTLGSGVGTQMLRGVVVMTQEFSRTTTTTPTLMRGVGRLFGDCVVGVVAASADDVK
jgi:hypothetical protein